MLKTSYSFMDLHDLEDEVEIETVNGTLDTPVEVRGISRERLARRMELIFSDSELGRDKAKLDLFVKFVFEREVPKMPGTHRNTRNDELEGIDDMDCKRRMPESGEEAI